MMTSSINPSSRRSAKEGHKHYTFAPKDFRYKGVGKVAKGRRLEESDVSLVRLRSFACDDMHSRAIDHVQSSFLFWGRRRKKNTLVKFIAVRDNKYGDIGSMFLTFCSSATHS
jgi:hypothetical protein